MIVDTHTHLWTHEHLGDPFRSEARGRDGRPPDLESGPERHQRGTAAADKVIVFAFDAPHIGVQAPNEYVSAYVASNPTKLIGYASVNPKDENAGEKLSLAVQELGLRGLKLAPAYQDCHPLDERLMAIYSQAETLGIPVTLHMGTTPHASAPLDFGRPIHVDEIARTFPQLRLVIAHVGHPWEAEALVVMRKHATVYGDISALVYRPFQLYHTLRLAYEYAVDSKLLLGSDFPWISTAETIRGLRELCRNSQEMVFPIPDTLGEDLINRDALTLLGLAAD